MVGLSRSIGNDFQVPGLGELTIQNNSSNVNCGRIADSLPRIRFIFLDRDGILNRKLSEGQFVTRREHLELLPGAARAVAKLNDRQLKVIVVTNQRAIGLGMLTESELNQLHNELRKELGRDGARLDAIYYCPHDPDHQECACRKPDTGMFELAIRDFPGASKENCLVIGDSLSDIQAGSRMGMYTVYVRGENANRKPGGDQAAELADAVASSLEEAVEILLPHFGSSSRPARSHS